MKPPPKTRPTEPPLPNRVAEMLLLANVVAIYMPARLKSIQKDSNCGVWKPARFVLQMRSGVPWRGSVTVESKGGWTYKMFADAVKELLSEPLAPLLGDSADDALNGYLTVFGNNNVAEKIKYEIDSSIIDAPTLGVSSYTYTVGRPPRAK